MAAVFSFALADEHALALEGEAVAPDMLGVDAAFLQLEGIGLREEALEHAHVERLAEAPRAADKRHLVVRGPPLADEVRLVHQEVVALAQAREPLRSDGNRPARVRASLFEQPVTHDRKYNLRLWSATGRRDVSAEPAG